MLTIWFIGMYVIFILQQLTILYENIKKDKLQERINKAIELIREYKQCLEQGNNKNADYIYISSLCNKLEMLEKILEGGKK